MKNKLFLGVVAGVLIIGAFYFGLAGREGERVETGECLAPSEAVVTKVLDGDTVIVEGGHHVRLLGIDADEAGYPCYGEAKNRLEELVLAEEVRLEKDESDVDQYDRCLRYLFLEGENINLKLVEEGLAVAKFYPPDVEYQEEITQAEKEAMEEEIGCKWGEIVPEDKKEVETQGEWEELTTSKLGYNVVGACQAGKVFGERANRRRRSCQCLS